MLNAIVVYVLGTYSGGLWAQALVTTGVETATQKIHECLLHITLRASEQKSGSLRLSLGPLLTLKLQ